MATVGQVYYNVVDKNSKKCISSGPNIFKEGRAGELVSRYGANRFIKLGIQAPPGTRAVLNETKEIMIGATNVYELDDVPITSLYFIRPLKYEFDKDMSDGLIDTGINNMKAAEKKREDSLIELNSQYDEIPDRTSDPDTYKSYWSRYNEIQSTFIEEYNEALKSFMQGQNGYYKLPNENDITSLENYDDLFNIIIDFIYE